MVFSKQKFILISCMLISTLIPAMQRPTKSTADLLAGAAAVGHIENMRKQIAQLGSPNILNTQGYSPLGLAVSNGHLEAVRFLLDQKANANIKDSKELTPLLWAIINSYKNPAQYLNIIQLLVSKGADIHARDKDGFTVLHYAARIGDLALLDYLLASGAQTDINAVDALVPPKKKKGRTPLAEAVRAAKEGIIHLDIENKSFTNAAELEKELPAAIAELKKKEENKLSIAQLKKVVALLRQYKAHANMPDEAGKTLDYYINAIFLVGDKDRQELLAALGLPISARSIRYSEKDIPQAITLINSVRNQAQPARLATLPDMIIWTLQKVQKETGRDAQYAMLRIAMSMLAKLKDEVKSDALDTATTIIRDAALTLTMPSAPQKLMPITKPAPAAAPKAMLSAPQLVTIKNDTPGILIAHLISGTQQIASGQLWQGVQALEQVPIIIEHEAAGSDIFIEIQGHNALLTQANGTQKNITLTNQRYTLTVRSNGSAELIPTP